MRASRRLDGYVESKSFGVLPHDVLNEALRAQLMQIEAQKYRIAADIRIAFYDASAAQQRVNLIREFQSVVDKGVDLAAQLKEAQEGSQLEVVQAKMQKNEIDLTLRQAQVRYDATWRELAALAIVQILRAEKREP